jgi:hypothetical protein
MRKLVMAFGLLTMALAATGTALAACTPVTTNLEFPAVSPDQLTTNPDGSVWTLHVPTTTVIGTLTLSCPSAPPASLATGRYTFTSNSLAPDAGYNPDVGVQTNATGNGNSCEKWTWNGSTLQATSLNSCVNITGHIVDVSGRVKLATGGDTFTITASGTGWLIKDVTTGQYLALNGTLTGDPGSLLFSTTIQTVWTANAN